MGFNKRLVVDLAEKFSDPEDGGLGAFVCRICASEADGRGFPLPFSLASGGGQVESEAGGRARGRGAVAAAVTVAGREPALSTSPRAAHLASCSTAHLSPQPRFRVSPAFPRAATSLARPAARNGARALPNFPASAAQRGRGRDWLGAYPADLPAVRVPGPRGLLAQSPRPAFKNQGNRC